MAWLQELVDEGFFSKPKTSVEILSELEQRGHHLKPADITYQMQKLVRDRRLRRQERPGPKGRQVWGYSNW